MSLEDYYARPTNQRVAVVAINVLAPAGRNRKEYWDNVCAGLIPITTKRFTLGNYDQTHYLGEVTDEDIAAALSGIVGEKQTKRADKYAKLAVATAIPALLDSGLLKHTNTPNRTTAATYELLHADPYRIGVDLGIAVGGSRAIEKAAYDISTKGLPVPATIPNLNPAKGATEINEVTGIKGTALTHNMACSSGTIPTELGRNRILLNQADVVITGASESATHPVAFEGFRRLGVLAEYKEADKDKYPRFESPLKIDYRGIALGEGAGILVLARLDFAIAHDLPILAELAGAYSFTDPDDDLLPTAANVARLVRGALTSASLEPTDIDYLNTHTGGSEGDNNEIEGEAAVFGNHAPNVAVRPSKLSNGHSMGGAGAIESYETVESIITDEIPPIPYDGLIDSRGLDFPRELRRKIVNAGINVTLGLDGQFNALVFVKPERRYRELRIAA